MKRGRKSFGEKELIEQRIISVLKADKKFCCNRVSIKANCTSAMAERILAKAVNEGKAKTDGEYYWGI